MSDKAAKLKEKLKKQKSKDVKKVRVVVKTRSSKPIQKLKRKVRTIPVELPVKAKKVKDLFVPTTKTLEKKNVEETKIRGILEKLQNEEYDMSTPLFQHALAIYRDEMREVSPEEKPEDMDEKWELLSPAQKNDFILRALAKQKNAPYGREEFIEGLINLPDYYRMDFIQEYLAGTKTYVKAWHEWIAEHAQELEEKKQEEDKKIVELSNISKRTGEIRNAMLERALDFAQEHGRDVSGIDRYHDVLDLLAGKNEQKRQKVHKKIVSKFINLATELGFKNADKMSMIELASSIARREDELLSQADPAFLRKVERMSRKKMIKKALAIGVENAEELESPILLAKLLHHNIKSNKGPASKSTAELQKIAKHMGIDPKLPREKLIIAISAKKATQGRKTVGRLVPSGWGDESSEHLEMRKEQRREQLATFYPKWTPEKIQAQIDEEFGHRREDLVDSEKKRLVDKLVRITGRPIDDFRYKTMDDLHSEYEKLEQGDEYWTEFVRDTIIEKLAEITGNDPSVYVSRDTEDLEKELERLELSAFHDEETNKVRKEFLHARKCVSEFREYNWIKGKVTGVWIYPLNDEDIIRYTTIPHKNNMNVLGEERVEEKVQSSSSEDEEEVKRTMTTDFVNYAPYVTGIHGKTYAIRWYRANKAWFTMQCNKFANRRIQEGNVLTCFDTFGKPHQFVVAYSMIVVVNYTVKQFGADAIKIMGGPFMGQRLIVQNEEMFEASKRSARSRDLSRAEKIQELLNHKVDNDSIHVARSELSFALLRVASDKPDYGAGDDPNTPYLNIAINSVRTGANQNNRDFFYKVATIITFLTFKEAVIFRARVASEYYLPDVLMNLGTAEMLPEVFDNPLYTREDDEITYMDTVISHIISKTNRIVQKMGQRLFQMKNPTLPHVAHQTIFEDLPVPNYEKTICANKDEMGDIPKENLTFYYDEEKDATYCLDVENIIKRMSEGDFTNPYTGKKFPKDFRRRVTVTYIDHQGRKFILPYNKLQRQFAKGNYMNPKTGEEFDIGFVKKVRTNKIVKDFKKLDARLVRCENPQDVEDEPPSNVIFYKDSVNGRIYCFAIDRLSDSIIQHGRGGVINPYTNRHFSKRFIKQFRKKYNVALKQGGLRQQRFQDIYGENMIPTLMEKSKKSEEVAESKVAPPPTLLIPNLWSMISKDVTAREGYGELGLDSGEEVSEESSKSSSVSSFSMGESKGEEEGESNEESKEEKGESNEDESKGEESKASFGMGNDSCSKCSKSVKPDVHLRTIRFTDNDNFRDEKYCSIACFEDDRFKWHGRKRKK
uniref:Uncharacterized protein n=1 Tax=viral metagenome TaxID=1070528 RepID=A0A6C0EK43_9ZZZZ